MKNLLLILLFINLSVAARAQFVRAYLGVDGLTCSQCSRSVEMQLRKLPFINHVSMDLEHTSGELLLDPKKNPDFHAIAHAVQAAGFSVRYLRADFNLLPEAVVKDGTMRYKGQIYKIAADSPIAGKAGFTFVFLDRDFTSASGKNKKTDDPQPSKTYLVRVQ